MRYWETADQFYSINIGTILPEYNEESFQIINEEVIEEREKTRKRFKEFQYALGGLLLFKKRYNCLLRIFQFTNSIPPQYELLPSTMEEIIHAYLLFRDPYEINFQAIQRYYYFPEMEGLNADRLIKNWICTYLAVLFLRQYTLDPHIILSKPLEAPQPPDTQRRKKIWIDNIDYFRELVKKVHSDSELTSILELDFITEEWCQKNDKPYYTDLIDEIKSKVVESYDKTKVDQNISEEKITKFNISSIEILSKTFKEYNKIKNEENLEAHQIDKWYIHGLRSVVDKSAFADDQEADHSNYDSFFASQLSSKFQSDISSTFYLKRSHSFLLKREEIFAAIDKLKINRDEHLIISFRHYIPYHINILGIPGLTEDNFQGIELVNIPNCNYELVGDSLFILKKADLPNLVHMSIPEDEIKKYSLNLIDTDINLYTSVIDLNLSPSLLKEFEPTSNRDLQKSVLISLLIKIQVQWKKEIQMVHFKAFSEYKEKGIPNRLSDIVSFDKF